MQFVSKEILDSIAQPTPIRVALMLKPPVNEAAMLSYIENGEGSISLQDFPEKENNTTIYKDANDTNKFRFDKIYNINDTLQDVCKNISDNNLTDLLAGFNVCIMTFGPEGSGKTRTMFGNDHEEGVVSRVCQLLFEQLNMLYQTIGNETTVSLNYYELFAENIYDLLSYESGSKALKTSNEHKTNNISIKGLRTVTVNSSNELLSYVNDGQKRRFDKDSYYRKSRSNGFLNITVQQRNKKEDYMKTSVLQLIDLASTNKLDKNLKYDISNDELKSVNSSMYNLHEVVYGLSELELSMSTKTQSIKQPNRTSRLTKLLQQAIGGNSKTTAMLLCPTDKMERENTLTTLLFGSKLMCVENNPVQNKTALNQKAFLDLSLENMNTRKNSYLTRIKYLEDEVDKLGIIIRQSKTDASANKNLTEENVKLRDQLESLRKCKKTQDFESQGHDSQIPQNGKVKSESSEILDNLMEKCERVIQLQLRLDDELREKSQLSKQINYKESKAQALESINIKLLEQLESNEKELKNILNTNAILRKDEEKWMYLAESRSGRIEELEKEIQERQIGNFPQNSGLFVPDELNHIRDESKHRKGNWLFGNSHNNIWGTRKVSNVSTSSAMTMNSQESSSSRASHKGLNLHAVRPPE